MTRQSLEAKVNEILMSLVTDVLFEEMADGDPKAPEHRDKSKTALLKTVDRYVEEQLIDELENLQGADMRLYTNPVIRNRLATLRQQVKGDKS